MNDYRRAFDLIRYQETKFACRVSVAGREVIDGKARWRTFSTAECRHQIDTHSQVLHDLGIEAGNAIAVIASNCPEWLFLDFGAQQIGAVIVPVFPTLSDADCAFILKETHARLCFVSDPAVSERVLRLKGQLPELRAVYSIAADSKEDAWRKLLASTELDTEAISDRRASVAAEDLATIIFTSGTTGTPKGVMLSHRNLVSNVKAITRTIPLEPYGRAVSFLPLSHSYERLVTYAYIASGIETYYLDNVEAIARALKEVRPHYFTTVPRLIEKMYQVLEKRGQNLRGALRRAYSAALEMGLAYDERSTRHGLWERTRLWTARQSIFARWRQAMGGCVKLMLCGGATLQPRLSRLFSAAGFPLIEGYGLTETTTFVTGNRLEPEGRRVGSVGTPIHGVEVRIGDSGEILVRGPNVMMGYLNRPDLTAEVIDADGWLHTGDTGEFIEGTFLRISGRLKELFKLSSGEYVAPQVLESTYTRSPFIEHIMIVGEGKKHVAALIAPSFDQLTEWCHGQGLSFESRQAMVDHPTVVDLFTREIDGLSREVGRVQRVKRFALVPDEWSTGSGELSPTLKMKRAVISSRYRDLIESCYTAGAQSVPPEGPGTDKGAAKGV
jgi:long-chain acyl-CoA synthetase